MIRAIVSGLAVTLIAALIFLLIPAEQGAQSKRGSAAPETIDSTFPSQPSTKESLAKIEEANLWGRVKTQSAASAETITGKIIGAVSTRETKYVLLQVGKQTPVELKVGDVLPVQIEPFAGGRIVDIRADRISVQKNGETYVLSVTN